MVFNVLVAEWRKHGDGMKEGLRMTADDMNVRLWVCLCEKSSSVFEPEEKPKRKPKQNEKNELVRLCE